MCSARVLQARGYRLAATHIETRNCSQQLMSSFIHRQVRSRSLPTTAATSRV